MSLRSKVRKAVRSAGLAEEFGVSEAVLADYLIDSLDSLALVLAARDAGDERSNGPAPLIYRPTGGGTTAYPVTEKIENRYPSAE